MPAVHGLTLTSHCKSLFLGCASLWAVFGASNAAGNYLLVLDNVLMTRGICKETPIWYWCLRLLDTLLYIADVQCFAPAMGTAVKA